MPSLILIDGGLGQLSAAAAALSSLQIINQPLAAIAKREEIIYVCRPGKRAGQSSTTILRSCILSSSSVTRPTASP